MPDGAKSFDDLYNGVAANKQGLTPEKFREDMSNPDNRYKLWRNLTVNKEKGIPTDYGSFVKTYGFDKPVKKEESKSQPSASSVPTIEQQQQNLDALNWEQEQKDKHDLTNGALLATGQWVKDANGELIPKDPHANRDDLLKKGADDYFEGFMSPEQKKSLPYVNAFYNAKTPYEREHLTNAIKAFIPDWTPLPKAQWNQLQDTKSSMYLDALMKRYKLDSTQKSALENTGSWSDEQKASIEQGGELAKDMDMDAASFGELAYTGKNPTQDPSKLARFFSHLGQGLSSFATEGVFNPATQDEWNKKATDILQKNGISLQTKEQAEAANPTFGEKLANISGSGTSMILPMIAGSWSGDAMSISELTKGMGNSPNKILSFGGKLIGKSIEQAVPLQLMNWKQSVTKTGLQSGVYSFGDMILDRLPFKPVTALGKVLFGITKGMASGVAYTALEPTIKAGYESIKNDDSFQKEFGKYNASTQDYISQTIMMGVMGGWGGFHGTPEQKLEAENELKKDGRQDIVDDANAIQDNTDKINNTINELKNTPGQPTHAPAPVQEMSPITVTDDRAYVTRGADKTVEQNKPSSNKAYIRDFGSGEDDIKEQKKVQNDAIKKGLVTKTIQLKNKDGVVTGTRFIVTDPKHQHLGNRIYELSNKELNGSISPDEVHELTALEGEDVVKSLQKMADKAKNDGVKQDYNSIIQKVKDKTENGNGAKNEVIGLLKEADEHENEGRKEEAFKFKQKAEITALKYGGKVHWEGNDLKVEFGDEKLGTDKSVKSENTEPLINAVKTGDLKTTKDIADKENLNVSQKSNDKGEPTIEVKDGDKTIAKTDYNSIEDAEDEDKILNLVNNIGKTGEKETVKIEGMTDEEVAKGVQDMLKGDKSIEHEKLLDAAQKMISGEKIITDKRDYDVKDFNDLMNKERHGANSLFNRSVNSGIKSNAREGETTFNDLKKKSESPFEKNTALKQNIEKTDIETMKSMAKDISEDKPVDRKEYHRLSNAYPMEFNKELKELNADTKPVRMVEKKNLTEKGNVVPEQGMTEEDVDRLVSEKSENPQEIIDTYEKEKSRLREKESAQTTDKYIEDAIGKEGVDRESYSRFGDEKKVGTNIAKQFKKGGEKIDTIAKNASYAKNPEGDGTDITPEDVVNFMEGKKYEPKRSPLMKDLETRFKEVTGNPLTEKYIKEERSKNVKEMLESGEAQVYPFGVGSGTGQGFSEGQKEAFSSGKETVLNSLGISNIEKLSPTLQPYANGWNDVKGHFTENYNANLPIEEFKNNLSGKAFELRGQDGTEAEKIQNKFTADVLDNISQAVNSKQDIDNYAKIINGQNKFFIGGKEYYANTLKEIEAMKDFKRPQQPLTRQQVQEIKNNLLLNVDHMADAMEGKSEAQRVAGSEAGKIWRGLNKAFTFAAHIHTYAAPEIRSQVYQLLRNVNNMLVKVRHSDMFLHAGMAKTIRDIKLDDTSKEQVRKALVDGFYKNKDWSAEELKQQGLNDKGISAYNGIKNWLKNSQDTFKDAYKYYHKFYDMSPEKQKEYLDTHVKYMEENKGYLPAQRGEGNWAVTAFGKNPDTGVESRYFNKFKTEKEAKAETERLTKLGYTGASNEISDKGFGGKAINEKPKYYMMKPLERITHGEFRSVNDFEQALDKSDLSKEDKDTLSNVLKTDILTDNDKKLIDRILTKQRFDEGLKQRVIQSMERLKKGSYNPHFMDRSLDVNGNIVHGFDSSLDGIINNIEQFGNRAIQNKSRAGANYVYDKGKGFLDSHRHRETRKDMENFMENVNNYTVTPQGMQTFQNVVYGAMLAAKPKQILLGYLHNLNTVYGDTGNEINIINKERKQQGLPEYKQWASVLGTKAWGQSVNIAQNIIRGKALDIKDESLKNVINWVSSRGGLMHEFANVIDGTEATNQNWKTRAAFTGYSDLVSRAHAIVIGHELGKAKGLQGDGLNDYVENFVDRNKFQWNKYNAPQIFRAIRTNEYSTQGQKIAAGVVNGLIRNVTSFKGFMLQDIGWNRDMMQRAESKTATAARIMVPRIVMGGGLLKGVAAMTGVGVSAFENLYEAWHGQKDDEKVRKFFVKHLGHDEGNAFADINTYGAMGYLTGTDTRGLMDAGTLVQEGMPLTDQLAGAGNSFMGSMVKSGHDMLQGDYGKAMMDLPGEAGNVFHALHYYNNMVRNRENIQGEKALYTGSGTNIIPTGSDIWRKLGGFHSVDWDKYYTTQKFKEDMLGKGTLAMPDPQSKVGQIQTEIQNKVIQAYDKGKTEDIDNYVNSPTYENFEKAFGLSGKVQEYNHDLFNQYFMAKQSMNPKDFKDSTDILNAVRKYAIGVTNQDTTWMDMGDTNVSNNNFILNTIRKESERLTR